MYSVYIMYIKINRLIENLVIKIKANVSLCCGISQCYGIILHDCFS